MDSVRIDASPKQLSKLRNGHKVRVKPAMEGRGVCMIVKPGTYDTLTRAFGRGKGVEIALSPEEILANQQASASMEGQGIFGKKFDRFLEKRGIKKAVYKFGDVLKGGVKQGIDYARTQAPELGAKALRGLAEAVGRPELGTYAEAIGRAGADYGAGKLAGRAKGYLDNPEGRGFVSNVGGTNGSQVHQARTLAQQVEQQRALEALNLATGMDTGYMGRAGLGTAMANADRAKFIKGGIKQEYAGRAVGSSRNRLSSDMETLRGIRKSGGQIGAIGQAVLPPALQSQPYSENFQFQYTLPPAFQRVR
jgi:hypothetical protein